MSTHRPHAIALTGWNTGIVEAAPLQRHPTRPDALGISMMLASARELLQRLRGGTRLHSGGPPEPPEPERETQWDDPALWMLMLH